MRKGTESASVSCENVLFSAGNPGKFAQEGWAFWVASEDGHPGHGGRSEWSSLAGDRASLGGEWNILHWGPREQGGFQGLLPGSESAEVVWFHSTYCYVKVTIQFSFWRVGQGLFWFLCLEQVK